MDISEILPERTDRAVLVGQTGTGKTTLARYLLEYRKFVIIYDAKGLIKWQGYKRLTTLRAIYKCREPRIIYAPVASELRDETYHEAFFRFIYERKNTLCYVDETYAVTRGEIIPPSYHACLTRGRERNISVISSTQRPMYIPNVVLSESEHFYVLFLKMPQDRKKIYEATGLEPEKIALLQKRYFYYTNFDKQRGPLTLQIKR